MGRGGTCFGSEGVPELGRLNDSEGGWDPGNPLRPLRDPTSRIHRWYTEEGPCPVRKGPVRGNGQSGPIQDETSQRDVSSDPLGEGIS